MDYTTLAPSPVTLGEGEFVAACSLYAALQNLPDPRRRQGRRYELALLLSLVVLAKLAGQKSAPWSDGVDSSSRPRDR